MTATKTSRSTPAAAKAVVAVADRTVEVRSLPMPSAFPPGGGLLRVEANGLCGSDYDWFCGRQAHLVSGRFPKVPGHEIVGRIEHVDERSARRWGVSEGDRVVVEGFIRCGDCPECRSGRDNHCRNVRNHGSIPLGVAPGLWGGMAEYMVLDPGSAVYPVADDLAVEDCALFNALGNGFEWTVRAGGVGVGDSVLIFGGGQRGIMCALAASEAGASRVVVTGLSRDAHKLALALQFGATEVVDVEKEDLAERVGAEVDVAIDLTPVATEPLLQAIDLVRPEGTIVVAGVKGPDRPVPIPTDRFFMKGLHLRGAKGTTPWATRHALRVIGSKRFDFSDLHTHTYPLEQVDLAIRTLGGEVDGEHPIHVTVVPEP
jgi:threonine dehydrogenase-like Zn-dependent dehydrogenase